MDLAYYELVSRALFVPAGKQELENYLKLDLDRWVYSSIRSDYLGGDLYTCSGIETGIVNITSYTDTTISILILENNTGSSYIDIDGVGPVKLLDTLGNDFTADKLKANNLYTFTFDGTDFVQTVSGLEKHIFKLMTSVLETFEKFTRVDFYIKEWDIYLEDLSRVVSPRRHPFVSLDNIQYLTSNVWTDLTYTPDIIRDYPYYKIDFLDLETVVPDKGTQVYKMQITSGFGYLEDDLREAMFLTLASLIENNGACLDPSSNCSCNTSMIPAQARLILSQYGIITI